MVACFLVFFGLQSVCGMAYAKFANYLDVGRISDANFGIWTQAGSVSTRLLGCVASASDDSPNPKGFLAWQMPYQAKVENLLGGGDFYLYLDGDSGNTGNRRIVMSLSHRDVNDGGSFEGLSLGNYDNHAHVGGFKNCTTEGDNSELRINISGSELGSKASGKYRGDFRLTAIGGLLGNVTDSADFSVTIEIQSTPEVRISALDDLMLGTHSGLGDIYAEEHFCVYSSSLSGSYDLSVSSASQDKSGNFHLLGGAGLGDIPYALAFDDSGSGPGSTSVRNNTVSGFGDPKSLNCSGRNNATLSVLVNEVDLQQAKSGHYQDSLTILVEPQ